ncbi:hypothetical protein ACQ9LF_08905 [Anaerohalosphaeraceae bacterium U12dextr]|jgi:hypothetical protein
MKTKARSFDCKRGFEGIDKQVTELRVEKDFVGDSYSIYKVTPPCNYQLFTFDNKKTAWNVARALGEKLGLEVRS